MAEEKMRLKERAIEIIQSEKCREKGWKRKETVGQHKVYNIHAMGVPEGEGGKKERRSQTKNKQTKIYIYIFEEVMTKNFPNEKLLPTYLKTSVNPNYYKHKENHS